MQTILGQILDLVEVLLRDVGGIDGLHVLRNADLEYEDFPVIHQLDGDGTGRVTDRARGALHREFTLTIEGAVQPETPAGFAAAKDELYGAICLAMARMKNGRLHRAISDVQEEDFESVIVRDEEGIGPHLIFSVDFAIKFETSDSSPFALPL